MKEQEEEVLEVLNDTQDQQVPESVEAEEQPAQPVSQDDEGTIKVDLSKLNATPEEPQVEVEEQPQEPEAEEQAEPIEDSVIEEITEEQVQEQAEDLKEEVEQAVVESNETGVDLPENIQKVVDFMNDTGGSLNDYVKLNTDYSLLSEKQLLREYYENTRPHLEKDEIDFLMEDNFNFDEDLDEERDIRKKKIAYKEELAKAKKHLDGLKSKYYEEIKAGSRLNPEQQKAVEFFNRYTKETEEANKIAKSTNEIFLNKTNNVFNKDFKGFDYSVGDKKYRFKIKNTEDVKTTQSDINNFVKKFLNDKNEMSDAKGYHKSLFTAMNADAIASHFYEQGKADAIKDSVARSKNVDMNPRGRHEKTTTSNGWTIRSVSSDSIGTSSFKVKKRK
jgi:hypothetical protein